MAGSVQGPVHRRTVRDLVVPVLERLLRDADVAGDEEQAFWSLFDLLTRESLMFPLEGDRPAFSGICNDGTPWQFCATLGAASASVRYLTEIGAPGTALSERMALSRSRLAVIFTETRYPAFASRAADALFALLPPATSESRAGLWVAVAHGPGACRRIRLYANNGWGDDTARWMRLVNCLGAIGAQGYAGSLRPLLPILTTRFSPAGFAATVPDEPLICKLYLRPNPPAWRACREIVKSVHGARATRFLRSIERGLGRSLASIPDRALLLSLAASATGGALDVKLDFCAHCLFRSDQQAEHFVLRIAQLFGLDESPYRRLLAAMNTHAGHSAPEFHAFVGIGAAASGDVRVNVYTKPVEASRSFGAGHAQ